MDGGRAAVNPKPDQRRNPAMTSFFPAGRRAWMAGAALLGLSGCSASSLLHALVPTDTYRARPNQAYGPDPRQQLDIYRPATGDGPWPVVVFFYGGSWTRGDRADYRFVGEALASNGVLVVVADYRLSPQVRYPAFLEDCALATRWVFDRLPELGGDPKRVFLMGHSAGAYNAAMLALDARWLGGAGLAPTRLAGWIGVAGPYDFLPIGVPDVQVAFNWPGTPADSQPLFHVRAGAPRTLLLAASNDSFVDPIRNTTRLAQRLRDVGVAVSMEVFPGVSHVTVVGAMARPLRGLAPVLERVLAFSTPTPV